MPNVMAALSNIGGARCQDAKPVEICWYAPNSPIDLSRQWAKVHHIVRTRGRDIAV